MQWLQYEWQQPLMKKASLDVLVSAQISQSKGAALEDSPLNLFRLPKEVFAGVKLRIRKSSSSSVSERSMTWTDLEKPSRCSTETAFDLIVPRKEMGVKKAEVVESSTSITSTE